MSRRLHSLNNVGARRVASDAPTDSVEMERKACGGNDRARGMRVLLHGQQCYMAMDRFRRERERNKRYTFGDQWSDMICVDGRRMTEEQYILSQGHIPLKNNLIQKLVSSVVGVYIKQSTEPTCIARDREEQKLGETMSTALQYNMQVNRMTELNARSLEEFLISGFIVHRKYHGWKEDREDCWTDFVQPDNFFIDPNMRDVRGWDCAIVGEIHDVDFNEIALKFAKSPEDYKRLGDIYAACAAREGRGVLSSWNEFGFLQDKSGMSFLVPADPSLCRVIEIWRKETKERYRVHDWNSGEVYKIDPEDYGEMVEEENARRLMEGMELGMPREDIPLIEAEWFVDNFWYYYFLSPFGDILDEGETPYRHKSHPYVWRAYPFIDGEIHSFVGNIVDQQRYVNRLITLHDWALRASAKGLLMIPEDTIPDGMSPEDFADTWARFNGVIVYKPSRSGEKPHQVANNSTHIGINELLSIQLKLFEDISGVSGALQGKPGYAGMSASLYSMQTENSTTTIMDLLNSYSSFEREAALKDVKNIQQFYPDKKTISIAGKKSSVVYDPEKIADVEYDISVVPSMQTPVYRAIMNDFLMQIWDKQQITLKEMLEVGDFPFADTLLQSINAEEERRAAAPAPDPKAPAPSPQYLADLGQASRQAQAMADPQALAMLENSLQQ